MKESFGMITSLDVNPRDYYKVINNLNDLLRADFKKKLRNVPNEIKDMATFLVPGSDGRRENGSPMSAWEIIAILHDNKDVDVFNEYLKFAADSMKSLGIGNVEVRTSDSTLSFYRDNPSIIQPGRFGDALSLDDNDEALKKIKQNLGEEVQKLPGNKIDRVADLVKDARKVTNTGENRIGGESKIHFDMENGLINYFPNVGQLSFKIGPLRLVQNTLLLQQIRNIRKSGDTNLFSRLETSILPRLDQLAEEKKLSLDRESISEIQEIYAFFLRLYHRSEEEYRINKNPVLHMDSELKREISKRLMRLTELMKNFKIE